MQDVRFPFLKGGPRGILSFIKEFGILFEMIFAKDGATINNEKMIAIISWKFP